MRSPDNLNPVPDFSSRIFEIHHFGQKRFERLVEHLNPVQLRQIQGTHVRLRREASIELYVSTLTFFIGTLGLRLYHDPNPLNESNIAFELIGLVGASAGFYGTRLLAAAEEGIDIVNKRLQCGNPIR